MFIIWYNYSIINICPIDNIFDVRLFNFFKLSTDVLKYDAILYNESPLFTTYVFWFDLVDGIFIVSPIDNKFDDKLFSSFILSTVTLYFFAILYNESPETTL